MLVKGQLWLSGTVLYMEYNGSTFVVICKICLEWTIIFNHHVSNWQFTDWCLLWALVWGLMCERPEGVTCLNGRLMFRWPLGLRNQGDSGPPPFLRNYSRDALADRHLSIMQYMRWFPPLRSYLSRHMSAARITDTTCSPSLIEYTLCYTHGRLSSHHHTHHTLHQLLSQWTKRNPLCVWD